MSRENNKPLAFEEYLYFYREPISWDLNIKQLKQILFMHGLEKLSNHAKEEIIGAVRSLCLIPPTRSTVNICRAQIFPTDLAPSLEEMKQDIRDIKWQECPLGSVATVDPAALGVVGCGMADDSSSPTGSLIVPLRSDKAGSGIVRKRVRRNKKKEKTPLCRALFSSKLVEKPQKKPLKPEQGTTEVIRVATSNLNDVDDHRWTNKGSQILKGFLFPRMYYRCKVPGCSVMKYVDHDPSDPLMCIITYKGKHQH